MLRREDSDRPTLVSLNRYEKKKNAALAIDAFALVKKENAGLRLVVAGESPFSPSRLTKTNVYLGGYDPRVEDNMMTLVFLIDRAKANALTFNIINPASSTSPVTVPPFNMTSEAPDVLFLLNFTTPQRSALLSSPSTLALLYTPSNEHFGIGPVEAMVCGVPVLACDSGGPTESVVDPDFEPTPGEEKRERTGWLREPDPTVWATALREIVALSPSDRRELGLRASKRAKEKFGMEAMARDLEVSLRRAVQMGAPPFGVGSVLVAMLALLGFFVTVLALLLVR